MKLTGIIPDLDITELQPSINSQPEILTPELSDLLNAELYKAFQNLHDAPPESYIRSERNKGRRFGAKVIYYLNCLLAVHSLEPNRDLTAVIDQTVLEILLLFLRRITGIKSDLSYYFMLLETLHKIYGLSFEQVGIGSNEIDWLQGLIPVLSGNNLLSFKYHWHKVFPSISLDHLYAPYDHKIKKEVQTRISQVMSSESEGINMLHEEIFAQFKLFYPTEFASSEIPHLLALKLQSLDSHFDQFASNLPMGAYITVYVAIMSHPNSRLNLQGNIEFGEPMQALTPPDSLNY